jgi:Carboxypeptidase regulatory-like domain/Cohesin domain
MFRQIKHKSISVAILAVITFFSTDPKAVFAFLQNSKPAGSGTEATIRVKALSPVVPGRDAIFAIELVSAGKVVATSFTLNFDAAAFKYVSSSLGADRPETVNLSVNDQQTSKGKFGMLVDSRVAYEKGTRQIAKIVFAVSPEARSGDYQFFFNDTPARQGVAAIDGQMLKTDYETATVKIAEKKNAIVGRVFDQDLRGVRHSTVVLKLPDGSERTYRTGSFGAFIFDDLAEGTYTIEVRNKSYTFAAQSVEAKGAFSVRDFVEAM